MATTGVIIVAGGSGRRMGAAMPKQFMMLGNEPILARSINRIHEVARHKITSGGAERFFSVKNGLKELSEDVKIIAIHDAVRPLASKKLIIRLILEAEKSVAVIPVVAPVDSFRRTEGDRSVIIDRSALRIVQTPQVFDATILRKAYEQEFSSAFTDDASVVESIGEKITLCEGERGNIKITTPEDMIIANALIEAEQAQTEEY